MKHSVWHTRIIKSIFLCSALALINPAALAQVKERTLKYGDLNAVGSIHHIGASKFAELVKEKSNGKMQVKIYPSGQLGNEVQQMGQAQGGVQDFFLLSSSPLVSVSPKLQVLDFPGLIRSRAEAYGLLDGPIGEEMLEDFKNKRLVGLAFYENGFREFTNSKRPITSVKDFEGLKVRVIPNKMYLDMFSQLGTNPVEMPFTELYTALETGTVDGQDNATSATDMSKFYEVQKHMTLTDHIYNTMILGMSKKTWDDMSEDERRIIREAAHESAVHQRQAAVEMEKGQLANIVAHGVTLSEMPEEEKQKMRDLMFKGAEPYSEAIGADFVKKVYDAVEQAR